MKFLVTLQNTKFSSLVLLDLAYVVVLAPLLLMLKVPMLVFVVLVVAILVFSSKPAKSWLIVVIFMLGGIAIYLSLYGAFSFRGLSRLKLFLELLIYVLIVVVSMQRLTREINIYLLLSPFFFLALSLFFFYGMLMLIYVIFEVFFLLWMILSHRMQGDILEGFRASMVMFMYSLPWVVVLFIFFPRISFEHASYGFKGETVQRMGHDGTMYLDNKALLVPSDRIVMEVGFEKKIPASHLLYFRGSMLYIDKKNHWEPIPSFVKRKEGLVEHKVNNEKTHYSVTLYPTQKKWLYLLDIPTQAAKESKLDRDLISTVKRKIREPMHYAAISTLRSKFYDTLDDYTLKISTAVHVNHNPKTLEEVLKIQEIHHTEAKRANALVKFFQSQSLTYTLKPEALDINHTTDSFLFDTKKGYCVHFASSFVTMARMLGIPARLVTGYKGDISNGLKNYLVIKERDAHAWAELYIDKHWVRYETTSTASHIETQAHSNQTKDTQNSMSSPLMKKINLYLMYAKYQVETWILYYSNIRQKQLLGYLKENPKFIFIFISSFITLVLVTLIFTVYFKRKVYDNKALESVQAILKILQERGFIRKKNETLHQYFLRYCEENVDKEAGTRLITQLDDSYEKLVYADKPTNLALKDFKKLVKKATKFKTY
ncbi:MAG: DUF3488 and transglutaminase-like domain-containing protein [Sulfurovum sp.]|nr:DUF3488 and transglutaminase-like domain-containing protein [Sulfurovum sp.]